MVARLKAHPCNFIYMTRYEVCKKILVILFISQMILAALIQAVLQISLSDRDEVFNAGSTADKQNVMSAAYAKFQSWGKLLALTIRYFVVNTLSLAFSHNF